MSRSRPLALTDAQLTAVTNAAEPLAMAPKSNSPNQRAGSATTRSRRVQPIFLRCIVLREAIPKSIILRELQ